MDWVRADLHAPSPPRPPTTKLRERLQRVPRSEPRPEPGERGVQGESATPNALSGGFAERRDAKGHAHPSAPLRMGYRLKYILLSPYTCLCHGPQSRASQ